MQTPRWKASEPAPVSAVPPSTPVEAAPALAEATPAPTPVAAAPVAVMAVASAPAADESLIASLREKLAQQEAAKRFNEYVKTLVALGLLPELDTRRFLYAMKCTQIVELKPQAATGKPHPSPVAS